MLPSLRICRAVLLSPVCYLLIKYYSPLHVSSLKCSSSGGHSCIQAAYGTVTLYKSPGGLLIRSKLVINV